MSGRFSFEIERSGSELRCEDGESVSYKVLDLVQKRRVRGIGLMLGWTWGEAQYKCNQG